MVNRVRGCGNRLMFNISTTISDTKLFSSYLLAMIAHIYCKLRLPSSEELMLCYLLANRHCLPNGVPSIEELSIFPINLGDSPVL